MGHGKAAAGLLNAGVAEDALQGGRIGHAETGAVDVKSAVAAPTAVIAESGLQRPAHTFEQTAEYGQRETHARFAIGRIAKYPIGKVFETCDSAVAVEDLQDKKVNRGDGVKEALAKTVANLTTNALNLFAVEDLGQLAVNAPQGGLDVSKHSSPP